MTQRSTGCASCIRVTPRPATRCHPADRDHRYGRGRSRHRLPGRTVHRGSRGRTPSAPRQRPILDAHYTGARPAPDRGPRPKTTVENSSAPGPDAEAFRSEPPRSANTRLGSELGDPVGPSAPPTASKHYWPRCTGRWSSAGSAPLMSGPSRGAGAGAPQPCPAGDALVPGRADPADCAPDPLAGCLDLPRRPWDSPTVWPQ